jgi:two-component system LytT family response regulator
MPEARPAAADRFVVRTSAGYRPVRASQVHWIEAQGNYACLHMDEGTPLLRETMASLARRLEPDFIRVHRRAIVNRERIARIEPCSHGAYRIVLVTGDALLSGRSYNSTVRSLIA